MPKQSYMPTTTADGIGAMLLSFDTNINANGGALATKYGIAAAERTRVTQARPSGRGFRTRSLPRATGRKASPKSATP